MQKILQRLNERQLEAVAEVSRPLLVLAGAGSGKTSVITSKIAYLIREQGLKARSICALTFTNKAAREMRERINSLLKRDETKGLWISTFHSLGLEIIRKEAAHLDLKTGFSLFDSEDAKTLIRDLMHRDDSTSADKDVINQVQATISNWKNDLITPIQAATQAEEEEVLRLAAMVYAEYERHLRAYNAVDFDDLILLPVQLFQTQPEVLQKWQHRLHYFLVDEYQDTNSSQYLLVKLLTSLRNTFTVVGDDDQSIYSWRGARPENLNQLSSDYPNLKVIKLEQNYRSVGRILKAANHLIANNPHVHEKKLWSQHEFGDPIRVIECPNEEAEAERVAAEIMTRHLKEGCAWKDFAVLYRSNFQARILEIKLQAFQIPYKISGGTSFFARSEIKDVMGYLRLLINPDDDNAFLRIINLPRREIGPAILEKLATYAKERGLSLFAACDEFGLEQRLSAKQVEHLRLFTRWLSNILYLCETGDPLAALYEMLDDIDYQGWLSQNSSSSAQAERRFKNVQVLLESLHKTLKRLQEDDETSGIQEAIARLVLRDLLEQQEQEDETDKVQLLTLHASKGLEFPQVFLMGMEEELLPHRNSLDADSLEEERRLAYVGITRAQRVLTLTLSKQRKSYAETFNSTPSRFLEELPAEDLHWEGRSDQQESPEQQQQRKQSRIEALQAMLKS